MENSKPKKLSLNEVKMIYIKNYFRICDVLYRLEKVEMSRYADSFYKDYKCIWTWDIFGYKSNLIKLAKDMNQGKVQSEYLDPSHKDGDYNLRHMQELIVTHEIFAEKIENLYVFLHLDKRPAEKIIERPENITLEELFHNHKTSYLTYMLKPETTKEEFNRICAMVDKINDNDKKIEVLSSRLKQNLTNEEKNKYLSYINFYQNENKEKTNKIYPYLKSTRNAEDDWLFKK